jgi:hypothetical protein
VRALSGVSLDEEQIDLIRFQQAYNAAAQLIRIADEPATESYLEVIDVASGRRVLTAIEFLSPSNKRPGEGCEKYRQKLRELKEGGVSLVEIDLLRAGRRTFTIPPESMPESHRTHYRVCVRRGWKSSKVEVYPVALRERLPVIPVPLRQSDTDVTLDLQSLIERAYDDGGYDDIDYRTEPDPPLDPAAAAWADALLREKELR